MKVLYLVTGIRAPAASGSAFIQNLIFEMTKHDVNATILSPTFIHTDKGRGRWTKKLEQKYHLKFVWIDAPDFIKKNFLLHFMIAPILVTFAVIKLLSRERFDLVHEFTSTPAILVRALIYKFFKIHSVFSLVVLNKSVVGKLFWFKIFNFGSAYLLPSHEMVENLIGLGLNRQKIYYLPPGIDIAKFKTKTSKIKAKKELGLPVDQTVLTYFGSLSEEKGILDLLSASRKLSSDAQKKALIVVFSYYLRNSETYSNIATRIKKEAPKNFKLYEKLVSVPLLLRSSDFLVYPIQTGHGSTIPPISILEALASGTPVITTTVIGTRELITPKYGILITPKKPSVLLNTMENAISKKYNFQAMQNLEAFDIKNIAIRLLSLYKKLNEKQF